MNYSSQALSAKLQEIVKNETNKNYRAHATGPANPPPLNNTAGVEDFIRQRRQYREQTKGINIGSY